MLIRNFSFFFSFYFIPPLSSFHKTTWASPCCNRNGVYKNTSFTDGTFALYSRGNPTVQGNSVIALAGLAAKISQLPVKDERQASTQYSSRKDWLLRVADTLMVVLDGNFKPKGEPMQWCQQVSKPH